MCFIEKINSLHLDVLKEIGNIGAAHAATALSGILDQKIDMSVPNVQIVSFDEMIEMAGGPDNVVATVFLRIEGDITGSMFFTLSLSAATYFIHKIIGEDQFTFDSPPPYSELSMSCLQEIGNILSGSYLSASFRLYSFKCISIRPIINNRYGWCNHQLWSNRTISS